MVSNVRLIVFLLLVGVLDHGTTHKYRDGNHPQKDSVKELRVTGFYSERTNLSPFTKDYRE